jgi:DNA-directed RNA polymerase I subunit RPA49
MAEKKRKRNDDGVERPAKKPAVSEAKGTVRVEFVDSKSGLGPILGMRCQTLMMIQSKGTDYF